MRVDEISSLTTCRRQLGTERDLNMVHVETANLQVWNNSSSVKFNILFTIMPLVSNRRISAVVWGFTATFLKESGKVTEKEKERGILFTYRSYSESPG